MMKDSMRSKLLGLCRRLEEIDAMLASPEATNDMNRFRDLSCERAEIEPLTIKMKEYEKAEADRKAAQEEAERRDSFRALFDAALGEREFANDLMRETVFERAYQQCQSVGTGAKDAIEAVTRDVDGVWRNPQQDPKRMPGANEVSSKKPDGEVAKKAFAASLFGGNR